MSRYYLQLTRLEIEGEIYFAGQIWKCILDNSTKGSVLATLCVFTDGKQSKTGNEVNCTIYVKNGAFDQLSKDQFELLMAIKESEKRMIIYRDPTWLKEGELIQVGSRVEVNYVTERRMTGTVRYVGIITCGRLFGVELDPPFHGLGTSSGEFKKKKYFQCEDDCAVFLGLSRIRLHGFNRQQSSRRKSESESSYEQASAVRELRHENSETSLKAVGVSSDYSLSIGERIVWMSDEGPEYGTVKWVGVLPDVPSNEPTVGVEFDQPIGSGTGRYKSQRLFTAKQRHASLVPMIGLMKLSDYMPDYCSEPCFDSSNFGNSIRVGGSQDRYDLMQMATPLSTTDVIHQKWRSNAASADYDGDSSGLTTSDTRVRQSPQLKGRVMPPSIAADAVETLCGKDKGLQGQSDSCGLESVIFSLFAFSTSFDGELYAETRFESLHSATKKLLVELIINPLRAVNYVSADRISRYKELVFMIRQPNIINRPDVCMGNTVEIDGDLSFPEEHDDPSHALKFLICDLLERRSLISLASGDRAVTYQISCNDGPMPMESLQHAIERTCISSQHRLERVPTPVLIIETRQSMHGGMIFPNLMIDISYLLDKFPRMCKICGKAAQLECRDCFLAEFLVMQNDSHHFCDVAFCHECSETFHLRPGRRQHHQLEVHSSVDSDSLTGASTKMELFSIVSLIKGHYVSFVLSGSGSGSPWLIYDGMARKTFLDRRDVFVPEIRQCADLNKWISDYKMFRATSFSALPELVQNMIRGLSLCFYRPVITSEKAL